jgi:hypothetical protein
LGIHKGCVSAFFSNKFCMCPYFYDRPACTHSNLICSLHCAQSMCYYQCCSALHKHKTKVRGELLALPNARLMPATFNSKGPCSPLEFPFHSSVYLYIYIHKYLKQTNSVSLFIVEVFLRFLLHTRENRS